MKFTIDSAAVRGQFMRDIVDRTIHDIHDSIGTVFGPNAADAYIHKNGQLYYTRDGKEVLASMNYDNVIANDVLKMIYQAVERQATLVGDGTTTLTMLYTNLYDEIRNNDTIVGSHLNDIRRVYKELTAEINEEIGKRSQKMSDDKFRDMLYTCTQDVELTELIHEKLGDAVKEQAYMVIEKSNIDNEMEITMHDEPLINAEKIYSTFSVPQDATRVDNTIIFYVDGVLDIANPVTLTNLASMSTEAEMENGIKASNILILCTGTTEVTRKNINLFQKTVSDLMAKKPDATLNNIIIAKILNSLDYTEDMKEDLIAYLYNDIGVGSVVQSITFESLLHQAFSFTDSDGKPVEQFAAYDFDPHTLDVMREGYLTRRGIAFAPGKGLRLYGEMPFVARTRYEELVHRIEVEKSPVERVRLEKRLRTVYGKFIEVRVGSTLIKDSQRKYELILDAVKSSMNAYKEGVLYGNSILHARAVVDDMLDKLNDQILGMEDPDSDPKLVLKTQLCSTLYGALVDTFVDLTYTEVNNFSDDPETFNLNMEDSITDTISGDIVEPVSIITTIIKNSTMCFELALSQLFCVDVSVRNYID